MFLLKIGGGVDYEGPVPDDLVGTVEVPVTD